LDCYCDSDNRDCDDSGETKTYANNCQAMSNHCEDDSDRNHCDDCEGVAYCLIAFVFARGLHDDSCKSLLFRAFPQPLNTTIHETLSLANRWIERTTAVLTEQQSKIRVF